MDERPPESEATGEPTNINMNLAKDHLWLWILLEQRSQFTGPYLSDSFFGPPRYNGSKAGEKLASALRNILVSP
jgi:hypothetical protein